MARRGRRADRWERLAASDPGLNRLTSAARGAFGVGAALGIEYLVASALGIPAMVPIMIGTVLTMMANTTSARAVPSRTPPLHQLGDGLWAALTGPVAVTIRTTATPMQAPASAPLTR
ncbi:hypothetical protein ACQP04_33525 [Pseudonocardia halophobica]|uniref:hypothetical protein n=1 Tax=Pseudonocardia halophobica TaxID=29401 RepID=UPI003D8A3382